jgi:rhomboid protease GluP
MISDDEKPHAVLCSGCRQLVGVNDAECLNCGKRRPGRRGVGALFTGVIDENVFVTLVLWVCGALYLASLAVDLESMQTGGLLTFFAPSTKAAVAFGASGGLPVFQLHRWWTPLSASWLHGGALHIAFNMLWVRNLVPPMAEIYGASRTVIVYVVSGVSGFLASSLAWLLIGGVPFIGGGTVTLGASASVFGLMGALLVYSRQGGGVLLGQQVRTWLLGGVIMGFMPGFSIDNWAHLGGFAGGYLCAQVLDPMRHERPYHGTLAVICLLASLLAVVYSIVTGVPLIRAILQA